jgi:hypothetical protein
LLCPVELLELDHDNPRLQTGSDVDVKSDEELIQLLADISALDELVTSICTNTYLNLEPFIVIGTSSKGPFRVLEGNRRLAAIKLISDPELAKRVGVKIPSAVPKEVKDTLEEVLVYRVSKEEDSRAFIGFKHINGPQRWDAYAKAKYVTAWYKSSGGTVGIEEIANKMGDNNNTLRAYIYSILMLEQAEEKKLWTIKDRANNGRFAFSHIYTAIGRKEYQEHLGMASEWSDKPPRNPIKKEKLDNLGEVLGFIYGSKSSDQPALVRSQNPDLKDLGFSIANEDALQLLRNGASLDEARDALKDPAEAFLDSLVAANIKISRAVKLMPKYAGGRDQIDNIIEEIFEQADTLKTMNAKKKSKKS